MKTVVVYPYERPAIAAINAVKDIAKKYSNCKQILVRTRFNVSAKGLTTYAYTEITTDTNKLSEGYFEISDWLYIQQHPHWYKVQGAVA